jgi:hypothetical protein
MEREEVVAIIRSAVERNVTPAGAVRIPVLSESGEQVAIEIIDALESAGFRIVRDEKP